MITREEIRRLQITTRDAYSYASYRSWDACVSALANLNYSSLQIEAILRSKHMRWACDASNKPEGATNSSDLVRYIKKNRKKFTKQQLSELVAQTFR